MRCSGFPVDVAFAVTDYKLQGKTEDKLVMSLAPRPFPPHHDLKGFYVAVSRVRKRDQLRVLYRPVARRGGFDHIKKLRHTLELKVWNEAYNASGDYDANLAQAAAQKHGAASNSSRKKQK